MDHVTAIRTAADRFSEVLATADPGAQVPTCPDWTVADLAWHLTEVHLFWAAILGTDARSVEQVRAIENSKPEQPGTVAATLELRARATAELAAQLTALADDEPRWTWWDADQTVGFTRRMQVCEATMHRVDAELAAGVALSPIAADVASLCVEHCRDVMWGWIPQGTTAERLAVVRFAATDTGQDWLVEVGHATGPGSESDGPIDWPYARPASGGEVTATVQGALTDLALWSWTRGGEVEVTGEPTAVAAVTRLHDNGIM